MKEEKIKNSRYLLIPMYIMVCFPVLFIGRFFGVSELDLFFYCCYAFSFLLILFISEMMKKRIFSIPVVFGFIVLLTILFRDRVLAFNMMFAAISFVLVYLLSEEKIEKPCWAAVSGVFSIFFLLSDKEGKLETIAFILILIYTLSSHISSKAFYYVPVYLFIFLTVLFFPFSDEPIRWTFFKNAISRTESFMLRTGRDMNYKLGGILGGGDISFTGYSDRDGLSGGLVDDEGVEELEFISKGKSRRLYIKGESYKRITKDGLKDGVNIDPDYNAWFVPFINSLYNSGVTHEEAVCFSRIERTNIRYSYIRTKDIIYPANPIYIDREVSQGLDRKAGKGFSYHVRYMVIDYASPYFLNTLGKAGNAIHDYDTISEYVFDVYHVDMSFFMTKDEYENIVASGNDYEKGLWEDYLNTELVTESIKELTDQITEGAGTDYEKAKSIESYLREYKYDKSVNLRKKDNYVESFLFETRKGYCVHYASAMVLMLRASGIPARVVSGYLHRRSAEEESVMSTEAHAWVEGYIRGTGWITFEPTATKRSAEEVTWGLKAKNAPSKENKEDEKYTAPEITEVSEIVQPENFTPEKKKDDTLLKDVMARFGKYALIVLAFGVVLFIIIRTVIFIHYSLLSPEKKLREDVRKVCHRLDRRIYKKYKVRIDREYQSIYDYIEYSEDAEEAENLKKLFDKYYILRFRENSGL